MYGFLNNNITCISRTAKFQSNFTPILLNLHLDPKDDEHETCKHLMPI